MAQQWDSGKKSANLTLSAGNTVATQTASNGTFSTVIGTTGLNTERVYWECTFTLSLAADVGPGIAAATESTANFVGQSTLSLGWFGNGQIWYNNANTGTSWATFATGNTVCVAVDFISRNIWGRVGNGNWNNSSTANPATGTGGFNFNASIIAPFAFPAATLHNTTIPDTATVRFAPTSWQFTPPNGFSAWDAIPGRLTKALTRSSGSGPYPLIARPWRGNFSTASTSSNAVISVTQANQTATSITATNTDHASIVVAQASQTASSLTATVGSEPIRTRPPFQQLPGKGPRPLVPQPWRYYVPLANAGIVQTQADNIPTSITATNAHDAAIAITQASQTANLTATVGSEPIKTRSPFKLLPGKGPRPLVPQPWRYYVPLANAGITVTQAANVPTSIVATQAHITTIIVTQADQSATAITATNADHAAIVISQNDQLPTHIAATNATHAAIVKTQANQTVVMTAHTPPPPRLIVAQPQFLW